jgi:ubiquinone/menaquinone biosynthesis C-methylase UbiE
LLKLNRNCPAIPADNGHENLAPAKSASRFCREIYERSIRHRACDYTPPMSARVSRQSSEFKEQLLPSARSLRPLRLGGELVDVRDLTAETPSTPGWRRARSKTLFSGIKRRWFRSRRRRKVARAYDMALEIARVIPYGSRVLDVGCGNGFIAHHLTALLGTSAVGTDVTDITQVPISYRRYDRTQLPAEDNSFDAVLLCYVLHHAEDAGVMLKEMRRVLCDGGFGVIYEDIPALWWDRFICWTHNLKWRNRTGACTFRSESEWRSLFESSGFEVVSERQLARLRNVMHPVRRRLCVLRKNAPERSDAFSAEVKLLS